MKKFYTLMAIVLVASMFLSACGSAATPAPTAMPAPTQAPVATAAMPAATATVAATSAPTISVGMVTDTGGIDDKSFNSLSYQGVQNAVSQLGVKGSYLESKQQSDYQTNIQQFISQNTNLIATVGFLMGVDTATAAKANPKTDFVIVDYTYPDCSATPPNTEGKDCGSATVMPNVEGTFFQTDQAAFLGVQRAVGEDCEEIRGDGQEAIRAGINQPEAQQLHDDHHQEQIAL